VARASATIKFQGDNDKTLPVSPRKLLGTTELEGRIIVVRGQARRDDEGNLVVLARQLYFRPKATEGGKP
jgi:hypothetical protein